MRDLTQMIFSGIRLDYLSLCSLTNKLWFFSPSSGQNHCSLSHGNVCKIDMVNQAMGYRSHVEPK